MREGTVRQWCRMFKNGRTDVHGEEGSGRPPVVRVILFKMLTKKFVKDGASKFQNFHVNFHKFHALFSTRLSLLGYAVCVRWVPKMLTGVHNTQRMASALTF
jgi:hypothetical protein